MPLCLFFYHRSKKIKRTQKSLYLDSIVVFLGFIYFHVRLQRKMRAVIRKRLYKIILLIDLLYTGLKPSP